MKSETERERERERKKERERERERGSNCDALSKNQYFLPIKNESHATGGIAQTRNVLDFCQYVNLFKGVDEIVKLQ